MLIVTNGKQLASELVVLHTMFISNSEEKWSRMLAKAGRCAVLQVQKKSMACNFVERTRSLSEEEINHLRQENAHLRKTLEEVCRLKGAPSDPQNQHCPLQVQHQDIVNIQK